MAGVVFLAFHIRICRLASFVRFCACLNLFCQRRFCIETALVVERLGCICLARKFLAKFAFSYPLIRACAFCLNRWHRLSVIDPLATATSISQGRTAQTYEHNKRHTQNHACRIWTRLGFCFRTGKLLGTDFFLQNPAGA